MINIFCQPCNFKMLNTESINLPGQNVSPHPKNGEKHPRAVLSHSLMLIPFIVHAFSPLGITDCQKGGKKDWHALLIPLRYELYTRIWLLLIIIKKCLFGDNKDPG